MEEREVRHSVTPRLAWSTVIACLGTFQFGFHLSVMNAPQKYITCQYEDLEYWLLVYEKTVWEKFGFPQCKEASTTQVAMITACFTIGGLLSLIFLGVFGVAHSHGRKKIALVTSVLFMIGCLSIATSTNLLVIDVGRLLTGIAAGGSVIANPIWILELTPNNHRGLLGSLVQLAVAIGILSAQVVSIFWANPIQWRLVFVFGAGIALIQGIALVSSIESPKWLVIHKGDLPQATEIMSSIRSETHTIDLEISSWIEDEPNESTRLIKTQPVTMTDFLCKQKHRKEMFSVLVLLTGQQLCGMNAITFYGVSILTLHASFNVLYITTSLAACNALVLLLISPLVDRLGRKPLLIASLAVMSLSAMLMAWSITSNRDIIIGLACFSFVTGYSIGIGPLPFMMIPELTSVDTVGVAQLFGSASNWLANILVAFLVPLGQKYYGSEACFAAFAIICIIYLLTVLQIGSHWP